MASGELAVTSRTSDFLHVVFNAPRQVIMNYTLDIGLVDAHAEGDRAAEDADFVCAELLLGERSLLVTFARVVRCRINAL
jgi:hypothetical protein